MLETKSLKVGVSEEQHFIDLMQNFGWELKSSQEINVKESHQERRGDDIYSVTTSENYVKVVFQRDTNRPNYTLLTQLENKYFSILNSRPAPLNVSTAIVGLLFFIAPGVLYIRSKSKKKKEWENLMNTEATEAINRARALL